jgi:hypothetical protein
VSDREDNRKPILTRHSTCVGEVHTQPQRVNECCLGLLAENQHYRGKKRCACGRGWVVSPRCDGRIN